MRPDEHKKKRSAQYKKTHGISSSKPGHKNSNVQALGKNDGTTSEGRHSESDSTVSRPNQNVSTEVKSHSDPLKQQTRLEPTNSENSLHSTEVTSKKKFEKRKIESNWEKYECLDIADDENTLRGQDYQVLLDTTAGLQSGFRFKDEVDWESESSKLDAESEFLSINCAELAEAMLCVPLHQRLRITDSPFQRNEIDVFEQEAKNHASSYSSVVNRNKRVMTDNSDTHSSSSEQSCSKPVSSFSAETNHSSPENHRTQDGGMHDDLRVSSTSELSDKYAQSSAKVPDFRGGTNKIEETNSTENENTPIADSSKIIKTDMPSRVTIPDSSTSDISIPKSSESDLDFLLSLETPVVSQISAGQKQIVHQFSQEPSSDLKSSENGAEIQADSKSTVIATNTACDKTTASPAGDDLEDWLDSVLDD